MHTITLATGKQFHTHRGIFEHDELIGSPEGSVVRTTSGIEYLALRPLLSDYVLSMPRGAAVVYPKDAGQVVAMGDIYPGAVVVEAGVGSGALTMSLLRAVGDSGRLHSVERRQEFAVIAQANVEEFFGGAHPAWELTVGDLVEVLDRDVAPGSVDRVVLDMLAPWECLDAVARVLAPGGVLICYVATATQLSRVAEGARGHGAYTEPQAWESLVRGWHLEGLAVRPQHRMVGHTGFLVTARRMAPDVVAPPRRRRPAKGAYDETSAAPTSTGPATTGPGGQSEGFDRSERSVEGTGDDERTSAPTPEDYGERQVSERSLRRVVRAAGHTSPPASG
jgi:tRNA (adenine57-N1/adenine58-N1)-methyltransferase catalytic subunit